MNMSKMYAYVLFLDLEIKILNHKLEVGALPKKNCDNYLKNVK